MNKKITFIITLLFLYSCGFKPMLKDLDFSKSNIQKINYLGKSDLGYLIKNYINIKENNSTTGITVILEISENITAVNKNTSGITTEEDLSIRIQMTIKDKEDNILLEEPFLASKRLYVNENLSNYNETKNIEKNNLIRSLAQKIKFKLQLISNENK